MATSDNKNGDAAAALKREGTMQRTVREANDYGYGLTSEKADDGEPEEHHEEGNGFKPTRMGTMELTAQEGIQFLKDHRMDTLLETQGLAPRRKPAKDGDENDDDDEDDEDSAAVGAEEDDEDDDEEVDEQSDATNGSAAKLSKQRTMIATAKEGEELLAGMGGKPDAEARTRQQQKDMDKLIGDDSRSAGDAEEDDEEDEDEANGPEAKKPRRSDTPQETSLDGASEEVAAADEADSESSPSKRKH